MEEIRVAMRFGNRFRGELISDDRQISIGKGAGGMTPYELLLGSLGSCYYSTFIDIARKMRLEYTGADILIRGVKRDEVPTMLKTAEMMVTIRGAKSHKGFARASELAAKYCSIHATLSHVADITLTLLFEDS
ncbi:MAG: OsmC family protein [Eubacteriales bacterium]|nr:OsmC family protein [Eubacteriales bacterium]